MKVKEIKSKKRWEGFTSKVSERTFLQAWNWGEFQKKMKKEVWRLGVFEEDNLVGVLFAFEEKAKRGNHLLAPHAPLLRVQDYERKMKAFEALFLKLKEIARQRKVNFLRVAPVLERNEENKKLFSNFGFRKAPIHAHAEVTWQLDLSSSKEDLLMDMRKNTRYYIRKAGRNENISIEKSSEIESLEAFNDLYRKTVKRHDFVPFSKDYVKKEFQSFSEDDGVMVFTGKLEGRPVVSSIVIFWQGRAFYHHGASIPVDPPVSYGVQWEIIKEAKKRGCKFYNFWGIADIDLKAEGAKKHPWWGLTLFKQGFGGFKERYVKTQDLPLSVLYWPNFLLETIRRIKRGY